MAEENLKRAHVLISGIVQGVNFRYYTCQQADRLGVVGWVRNLLNGRVEAVFEGEQSAVENMLEWCREGPRSARVEHLEIEWETPTGAFTRFYKRMTSGE